MKNKDITSNNLELVNNILSDINNMEQKELENYLDKARLFYRYSLYNSMLLFYARAVNVKGFRQWEKIERYIKKGSSAIWILAPRFVKEEVKRNGKVTEEKVIRGFISVPVFDYNDTEGKPLPEYTETETDLNIADVIKFAEKLKFVVVEKELSYDIGGYIDDKQIVLNNIHDEKNRIGVLIHEISHGLLGHVGDLEIERDVKEQEAEMLTYLISKQIGIDRKSKFYLKCWGCDKDIKKSLQKINKSFKKFMESYVEEKK